MALELPEVATFGFIDVDTKKLPVLLLENKGGWDFSILKAGADEGTSKEVEATAAALDTEIELDVADFAASGRA